MAAPLRSWRCSWPMRSGPPVGGSASGPRTARWWAGPGGTTATRPSGCGGTASPWPPTPWGRCSASGPGRPAPSGAVRAAATTRAARVAPTLRPWGVPALRLAPNDALETLLARRHTAGLGGGGAGSVAVGGGWGWCAAVADEALELTARGRAVPAVLRTADGRCEARWLPAPAAADGERLRALVAGIPPVCRAEIADRSEQPVATPEALLTGALGELLDAAV